MIQEIIAFALLALAVFFVAKKFIFKKKGKDGCDTGCGCS